MAKLASRNGGEDPGVTYGDLAAVVQRKESMEFLHDILPKKVNVFLISLISNCDIITYEPSKIYNFVVLHFYSD